MNAPSARVALSAGRGAGLLRWVFAVTDAVEGWAKLGANLPIGTSGLCEFLAEKGWREDPDTGPAASERRRR
jgi:hypothetical protein